MCYYIHILNAKELITMAISTMYVNMMDKQEGVLVNCPVCKGIKYNSSMYDELCDSCRKMIIWTS